MNIMHLSSVIPRFTTKLIVLRSVAPSIMQVRWMKKHRKRKPKYLPTSAEKFFRIPEHPYRAPDEMETADNLLDEYQRKISSLRKLFQEELKQNMPHNITSEDQEKEEQFKILLEENKKENERIRVIREKVLEERFEAKVLDILQKEQEKKEELEQVRLNIEEIVRKEKERSSCCINERNLDEAIEYAIDNPININFAIGLDGSVMWEDKPPSDYEAEIKKRVAKGLEISYLM